MENNIISKCFGHLKTIIIHKHYVFINCCKAGIIWRGIKHDLSKFYPIEFGESIKYYTGTRSPIDNCKDAKGYSMAWLHHKGRNTHHYEYWVDYLDKGGIPIQMPYKDALEMVCDYLAAGMVYSKNAGKEFSYKDEYDGFWKTKSIDNPIAMHPQTKMFVTLMLRRMKKENSNDCLRKCESLKLYKQASRIIEGKDEEII